MSSFPDFPRNQLALYLQDVGLLRMRHLIHFFSSNISYLGGTGHISYRLASPGRNSSFLSLHSLVNQTSRYPLASPDSSFTFHSTTTPPSSSPFSLHGLSHKEPAGLLAQNFALKQTPHSWRGKFTSTGFEAASSKQSDTDLVMSSSVSVSLMAESGRSL